MSSAICFNLDQSEILSSGNGLNLYQTIPDLNSPERAVFFKLLLKKIEIQTFKHYLNKTIPGAIHSAMIGLHVTYTLAIY